MYVCLCRAVTDSTIARAIAEGARTVEELTIRTGAGSSCGACLPMLAEIADRACHSADACSSGDDDPRREACSSYRLSVLSEAMEATQ